MLTDVMHTITSSLQYPVVAVLIILVAAIIIVVGTLIAEVFTERRLFKLSLPKLIDAIQDSNEVQGAIEGADMLWRQKKALLELLKHPEATPADRESLAVDLVAKEQAIYDNRVKLTDLMAKVSPMLGLMGTLIPLGPGIIAIGQGATDILSESLLIAFDSTILGLVVAAVALVVSTIRKSWYAAYMSTFEAATECVLEKANAGAIMTLPEATCDALPETQEADCD